MLPQRQKFSAAVVSPAAVLKVSLALRVQEMGLHMFSSVSPDSGHVQSLPDMNSSIETGFVRPLFILTNSSENTCESLRLNYGRIIERCCRTWNYD